MSITTQVKKVGTPAVKFAAAGAGITVSAIGLKKLDGLLPATLHPLLRKLAPGVATMLIAYFLSTKVSDDRLKALVLGIGGGGALDAIRKFLPSNLTAQVPALSGSPQYAAVNTGGVGWDYYRDNALQGVSMQGAPYALSGAGAYALNGDNTFSMQGPGGGMSAMNSYALN